MHRNRLLAALAAGALLATAPVFAEEVVASKPDAPTGSSCAAWPSRGLEEGPVGVGYYEADFATGRRACPRTEVGIGARGAAIIDTPNFYGDLMGDGLVFGSVALGPKLEVFGTLEFLRYEYVQNASLKGTQMSLGQATIGGTYVVLQQDALALAPSVRLMLPTSTASPNVRTVGAEVGAAATYRLLSRFELHGYAGVDFSAGLSAAESVPRFGGLVLAGAQFSPWDWFGVVLDVNAHFGERAALDYVSPALALRFRIYEGLGAELGATLPLAGADRHDALFGLKITYRL